jgi:hypothetical protein
LADVEGVFPPFLSGLVRPKDVGRPNSSIVIRMCCLFAYECESVVRVRSQVGGLYSRARSDRVRSMRL